MKFLTIAALTALASQALSMMFFIPPDDSYHKSSSGQPNHKCFPPKSGPHKSALDESRGHKSYASDLHGDRHKLRTIDHNDDSTDLYE